MYLTAHAAVGIAMASTAAMTHPVGAFCVGWLSHYVADAVPHGDEPVGSWAKRGHRVRRIAAVFAVDAAVLGIVAVLYLFRAGFSWWAFAALVGSAVPDVMWGIEMVAGRTLFGFHGRLHTANHNLPDIRLPLWAGLVLQGIVAGGLWWWVMR